MSSLIVKIQKIATVTKHPNADRLDVVTLVGMGWTCITGRDVENVPRFSVGDLCIYLPVDIVLPAKLEGILFPPGSKVVLKNSRLRTEKIRSCISQGMVLSLDEMVKHYPELANCKLGDDVAELLGVMKYEPPAPAFYKGLVLDREHEEFRKYTDIENIKNFSDVFQPNELVHISEKLHGTSARFGCVPIKEKNIFRKALQFFGFLPRNEFIVGSRNKEIKLESSSLYTDMFRKLELHKKLKPGEFLYGEIVGPKIQSNFTYGCKTPTFYAYDLMVDGRYQTPSTLSLWCLTNGINTVPVIESHVPFSIEKVNCLKTGKSVLAPDIQPIREGVVVRSAGERSGLVISRAILKAINEDYLLQKGNTEFH